MNLLRFALVFFVLQSASAQEPDAISSEMESTRQVFLAEVDDARAEVISELDKKIRSAQSTSNLEAVKRLTTEKQEFMKNGTTPPSVNMRAFRRRLSGALRTLKSKFEDAIKKAGQLGRIEEAKSLRAELKKFEDSPLSRLSWGIADYKVESGTGDWQPFTNRALAFTNRTYVWNDISPSWPLKQFAPIVAHRQTPIKIAVTSPGWVYIAFFQGDKAQVTTYLTPNSWQRTHYVFSYNSGGKKLMHIFRKQLPVGKYVIPRVNKSVPVLLKP